MKNNQFYKNLFDKILNSDEFNTLLDAFVYFIDHGTSFTFETTNRFNGKVVSLIYIIPNEGSVFLLYRMLANSIDDSRALAKEPFPETENKKRNIAYFFLKILKSFDNDTTYEPLFLYHCLMNYYKQIDDVYKYNLYKGKCVDYCDKNKDLREQEEDFDK